jgi:hypothetical protein
LKFWRTLCWKLVELFPDVLRDRNVFHWSEKIYPTTQRKIPKDLNLHNYFILTNMLRKTPTNLLNILE